MKGPSNSSPQSHGLNADSSSRKASPSQREQRSCADCLSWVQKSVFSVTFLLWLTPVIVSSIFMFLGPAEYSTAGADVQQTNSSGQHIMGGSNYPCLEEKLQSSVDISWVSPLFLGVWTFGFILVKFVLVGSKHCSNVRHRPWDGLLVLFLVFLLFSVFMFITHHARPLPYRQDILCTHCGWHLRASSS